MQVIYDSTGKIFFQGSGYTTPTAPLNFIEVTVPSNHFISSIDVSKNPAEPVITEYPKSVMDLMQEQLEQQQADLDYLKLLSEDEEV